MLPISKLLLARSAFVLLVAWACYEFAGILHSSDQGALPLAVAGIIAVSALVASIVGFAFCALAGSALAQAVHRFFAERDFSYVHTPILKMNRKH